MSSSQQFTATSQKPESPRKMTRKTRTVLGDVEPNTYRTRSSISKHPTQQQTKKLQIQQPIAQNVIEKVNRDDTHAPRRSGRLSKNVQKSTNDESVQESTTVTTQHQKQQNASETLGRHSHHKAQVTTILESTVQDNESTEKEVLVKKSPKQRPMKRPYMEQQVAQTATRTAARRLSDEYDNVPPTKRNRHNSNNLIAIVSKRYDERCQEHHNLSLTNFEPNKYTSGLSPYDASIRNDVLHSPEYVSDIFQRLYHSEKTSAPTSYMHKQKCISSSMRAILVDWLVDVHLKFRCVPETLHLTVNIIDRYLSTVAITRDILQLVGITALLVASKYEEIFPPEVKDCVMICQRAYSVQQVLDMEADMLGELSFNLTVPTGHPFLKRFLFITNASETMSIAASYYTERMLQEHDALKYRPSIIAAAAVCLAINHPEIRSFDDVETPKPGVPKALLDYTGYTRDMILDVAGFVASKVCESVKTKADRCLVAVQRKFSSRRYRNVSTYFESPDAVDILDDIIQNE